MYADKSGNFLLAQIVFNNKLITLSSVYGPNIDDINFYHEVVIRKMEETDSDFLIAGGD